MRAEDVERLGAQLAFLLEADALKGVLRQSRVLGGERRENSAEHSWHLALFAVILADHAREDVDVTRVVAMLLVHDLVEIDAGDTFAYETEATAGASGRPSPADVAAREQDAADRLFGLLPADQASHWRGLWDEFESGDTADARFARAVDRFQPVVLNAAHDGGSWRQHGIAASQVRERAEALAVAPALADHAHSIIEWAVAAGILRDG